MNFNFEEDLKNELHVQFDCYGVRLPIKNKLHDFLLDYLTVRNKLIDIHPRKVLINPTFLAEIPTHLKKKEIKIIEQYFEKGRDVNLFQSKRIFQSNFHDHLANEWHIHHFHLSLEKEKKSRFFKQVNQLLFVYVTKEVAVFLGTTKHTEGIFADAKWIKILNDYFPHLIAEFKHPGIKESFPKLNAVERQRLWDFGYTLALTDVDDSVFISPGVGRMTSGHAIQVTRQVDSIIRWLHRVTEQFIQFHDSICNYLVVPIQVSCFQLRLGVEVPEIIEVTSNKVVIEFPSVIDESLFQG